MTGMCQCGHGEGFHDLNRHGQRINCDVIEGPTARKCPCNQYTPQETP